MSKVPTTDIIVKSIPSLPEAIEAWRFMPKPKPMTEYWRSFFETFLLKVE
jgi:hypothetical protein